LSRSYRRKSLVHFLVDALGRKLVQEHEPGLVRGRESHFDYSQKEQPVWEIVFEPAARADRYSPMDKIPDRDLDRPSKMLIGIWVGGGQGILLL